MIQQHLVEITACHLISVIGLRTIAVLKVKLRSSVRARAHDFAAVFFYEPGTRKFFRQPKSGKCLHAERQQRLADVKPRKLFALEENHASSGAREQRGGRAARRSAADDSDVVNCVRHAAINLASLSRKQTLEARQRQTAKRWRPPDAPGCPITHHWLEMVAVDPSILVRLTVNFSA